MSQSPTVGIHTGIPTFYRIFFTYLDPIMFTHGAFMDFFTPDKVLDSFIPSTLAPRNPAHDMLFHQLGGFHLSMAFLSGILLRYTKDLGVWRCLQTALLGFNFVGLGSIWVSWARQGRLKAGGLRVEDWSLAGIIGVVALVRAAFLCRVGFPKVVQVSKAKKDV